MARLDRKILDFIIEAKRNSYASEAAPSLTPCRPLSKDLAYAAGDYQYIDSYFGGERFLGEEVVYREGRPIWGMNYYGHSIVDADADEGLPPGSAGMGEVLHAALMAPPPEAPYRGPSFLKIGNCEYRCSWEGETDRFSGEEEILRDGSRIYYLRFHGGTIA